MSSSKNLTRVHVEIVDNVIVFANILQTIECNGVCMPLAIVQRYP
jgi:hypothetical protein